MLRVALAKGRLYEPSVERFARAGAAPADDERQQGEGRGVAARARERTAQAAAVLPIDPPPHFGAKIVGERREAGREDPHVPQVDLEIPHACRTKERDRDPYNLDVGGQVPLAQQLRTDLEHLARPPAALGLLPVHRPRVAEPEGPRRARKRRRGHPSQAGREVVPQREDPAVAVGKADQPLGDARTAGAEEGILVFQGRRDELLVRGPLEYRHGRAPELAAAAGGLTGEVECAGRGDGELRGKHGAGS